jgi:hypothetical protein
MIFKTPKVKTDGPLKAIAAEAGAAPQNTGKFRFIRRVGMNIAKFFNKAPIQPPPLAVEKKQEKHPEFVGDWTIIEVKDKNAKNNTVQLQPIPVEKNPEWSAYGHHF